MNPDHMNWPAAVFDASALLHAFLKENGDALSFLLQRQCHCSVINWLEMKYLIEDIYEEEGTEYQFDALKMFFITERHLKIGAFTLEDSEWIADKTRSHGSRLPYSDQPLSCLALGSRLGLPVFTCDPSLTQVSDEVRVILLER